MRWLFHTARRYEAGNQHLESSLLQMAPDFTNGKEDKASFAANVRPGA